MLHQAYRIELATLAIHSVAGLRTPVMIPSGAVVNLVAGPLDGDRMVDVNWYGKVVMMFTGDLRERGTQISAEEAEQG